VYFYQVNQTKYTVKAKDRAEAISLAASQWKEEFSNPEVCGVDDIEYSLEE
jgi:hypothetical protein